ncbi:conserved hypothetical protein [Uncinocarpus reesii 1704]|uniref:Mitochondrial outer membrane transport complex Sam37/metaxin N-terminal domain-containing protein n=1 Tax=Uncinocarpus reesii (strain UAMH 1704) TaxID=336963 RepID=C4JFM5_UNCRE|nr:uncharacterized protein UREG_02359 [Uncinocarpus reesii 1704]EEP77510.1 conserved hypothetical protein [Uncinocarpus reesii 1704]
MVLELHTWGPAFGLPSIDAQCLATIAYFTFALPKTCSQEWVLVPDSDPKIVPTNELPAVWTGSRWVTGFRNIVEFLKQYSDGEWDLDQWTSPSEQADCVAFSSFLELHGQSLIDLSLYVSSENYHSVTSPAYGTLLQWPNQWIIPPQVRSQAKARTEHLGLSSLDLDVVEEERQQGRDATALAAGQIPKSLVTKPRQTVSGLLDKNFAKVPDPMGRECFGGRIDAVTMLRDPQTGPASRLPWQVPQKISFGSIGLRILEGIADAIPVVKDIRFSRRLRQMSQEKSPDAGEVTALAETYKREALTSAATVTFGLGMFVFYLFKTGLIQVDLKTEDEQTEHDGSHSEGHGETPLAFGEAGSFLGL